MTPGAKRAVITFSSIGGWLTALVAILRCILESRTP